MADLYGKDVRYGTSVIASSEEMTLILPGANGTTGYLVQQVNISYAQSVARLYEIGSHFTYLGPGRAIGSCSLGRVVGNADLATMLGGAGTGMFKASPDGSNKQIILKDNRVGTTYKLSGCIVENYTASTDAQGVLVMENVAIVFCSLEVLGGTRNAAPQTVAVA